MKKMKRIYKGILKSNFISKIISILIFIYLHIVYFTSKKSFKYSKNFNKNIYDFKDQFILPLQLTIFTCFFADPIKIKNNYTEAYIENSKFSLKKSLSAMKIRETI